MNATHSITHAAWLGDGLLLLVATLPAPPKPRAKWIPGKEIRHVRSLAHALPSGSAWCVWTRHREARPLAGHCVELLSGAERASLTIGDFAFTDVKTLARDCFASLSAPERGALLHFLASASEPDARVARNLAALREILRERLVESVVSAENPQALHIEQLMALSDTAFFIRGWFSDAEAPATRLRACSPEGAQVELLHGAFRFARPDIARLYGLAKDTQEFGFMREFELPAPSTLPRGWCVELHADGAESLEAAVPAPITDAEQIRNALLGLMPAHGCGELLQRHIHPALKRLAARQRAEVALASVGQFGAAPASPAVSIVIALEVGGELIEHQLAQFANDPAVRAADIVFILCNPAAAEPLAASAARLCSCYDVPFRLAVPASPLSPSLARNAAAALAVAPTLVFLASSVFPDRPGWLAPLLAANPGGTAGAKLLREDDTLAHAGIGFVRNGTAWTPRSRFRGLQRHLPEACVPADVPALSGACFSVSRDRFEAVAGFAAAYATPQLDDADLFLRLAAAGARSRYVPDAELYHLPALKKPPAISAGAALYDAWLFDHTHGAQLQQHHAD